MDHSTSTAQPITSRRLPPLLVLFFGVLVVSTSSVFIRYAQQDASSIVIAAYRLGLASLILLPLTLGSYQHELRRLRRSQLGLAALSGVFLAIHFATWISSLEYTTVASSVVLVSTTPLWVAVLSPVVLRERPGRMVAIGMVVALAGGVLVGVSEACAVHGARLVCPPASVFVRGEAFWGNLLALAGALGAAAYLLVGRFLRPTMSLMVYIFTVYSMAAVTLWGMALASGQRLAGFPGVVFLYFLALAVGPQLLGHTSFNYGLRYLSAAYVSVALLGEPIGSTVLALVVLGEIPALPEMVGGAVILVGIFLASRSEGGGKGAPGMAVSPGGEKDAA
jgi:drug/metabolite transporter (DMT)-like permease